MKPWGSRLVAVVLLVGAIFFAPAPAYADAVDDAFARGNKAAAQEDWEAAVVAYEQAAALHPSRTAVVSFNLGTAYAELGDLGRATYHLERALDWRGGPTASLSQSARSNLAAVRRQIELRATTDGTMVDRPATSWDLVVEGLESPGVGWTALVCGWLFLLGLVLHRRRVRRGLPGRAAGVGMLIVLGICYLVAGSLHAWAVRAGASNPEAIVLDAQVDAREGPGQHRPVEFTVQGGAHVRVVDASPGWQQVQLPGGVSGWVPESAIGKLAASRAVTKSR